MSYTPNTWIARTGANLNKFTDQNGNEYVFTPAPGNVVTAGTPFSADWMNNLEQGVAANDTALAGKQDAIVTATALPESGTALAANTLYEVTDAVGTYQLVAPESGQSHGSFTTADPFTITFGTGAAFLGAVPSFEASKTYEFDVLDNVWAFAEVVSA